LGGNEAGGQVEILWRGDGQVNDQGTTQLDDAVAVAGPVADTVRDTPVDTLCQCPQGSADGAPDVQEIDVGQDTAPVPILPQEGVGAMADGLGEVVVFLEPGADGDACVRAEAFH